MVVLRGTVDKQDKLFDYLKKTAAELQETRRRLHTFEAGAHEPLAIVGMACRLPGGADTPQQFWDLLAAGGDGIGEFPDDRGWDLENIYDPDPTKSGSITKSGGFMRDASGFDSQFFRISPREAMAMDPQQRILMEVCWEALEHSGIDAENLRGTKTGVFVGGFTSNYAVSLAMSDEGLGEYEGHMMTGNLTSVMSGRVAYALGLEGTALTVDTACSSSLVALHLACQAVRSGECTTALAGGITVLVNPGNFFEFSRQQGLAADGRCRAFSADASGTGWSEGAGMIVIERLSDARRQGHHVLAVIRGSAANQDGASNGLTAPNGPSQQRVIQAALANAQLSAADVDVVEAHGTATTLGDPIEAQALLNTYGQERPDGRPLWLGSAKSNIGHTQAAAGVAGVMKMVLALQNGLLPQTLHVTEPTPFVDWDAGDVKLLTAAVPWPAGERVRRAGVSAFGGSGTNVHMILEEAPAADDAQPDEAAAEPVVSGARAWLVSGRSADGLSAQAVQLHEWAAGRADLDAAEVAWSLATTRSAFEHRAVVVGGDRTELLSGLANLAGGVADGAVVSGVVRDDARPVFVFPGQGSQWLGMGRELAETSPVFQARLAECEQALAPYVDWSLTAVLSGADAAPDWNDADVVQPLLWAVMVSLAAVWEAAGVTPHAVVGHSQGEIAAATVAGMLSIEDAAKVVALRSQTLRAIRGAGGMLSVAEPVAALEQRLGWWGERISVAAVNGPAATVLSGEPEALEELNSALEAEGIRARMVAVDYASHGPQVQALEQEILSALAGVTPRAGRVPMVSAMSGETLTGTELDAAYWYASLRNPVHFERAVRTLAGQGHQVFIEVSPHPVLMGAMNDTCADAAEAAGPGVVAAAVCGTLRRDDGGSSRVVTSFAEAFVQGAPVDWAAVLPATAWLELPTYAFRRTRYWPEGLLLLDDRIGGGRGDAVSLGLGSVGHPFLGAAVELAGGAGLVCTGRVSLRTQPWLADHAVGGVVLLPSTGFVELAVRAGDQAGCGVLEELTLQTPMALPADGGAVQVQVVVAGPDAAGRRAVEIYGRADDAAAPDWVRHASGTLSPATTPAPADDDLQTWPPRDAQPVDITDVYAVHLSDVYGPAFQGLRAAWRRGADIFAEVALPEELLPQAGSYDLHPALLDAALHGTVLEAVDAAASGEPGQLRMPFAWTDVELHATGASVLRVRLRRTAQGGLSLTAADTTGAVVVSVGSLVHRPVSVDQLRTADNALAESLFVQQWVPVAGSAVTDREWALFGPDHLGLADGLTAAGVAVRAYDDLAALAAAAEHGDIDPALVLTVVGDPGDDAALPDRVRRGATSALALAHAWLDEQRLDTARLVIVTRGAVAAVDGDEITDLIAATARGLLRSAQAEYPDRLILADLPATEPGAQAEVLPSVVDSGEPELVVRDRTAYGRRLTRPAGELAPAEWPSDTAAGRALLVTGGTGTLGGLVARHFVATGRAAGVVLLSRSGPAAAGCATLAAEVARLGGWVRVVACDSADRDALAAVLATIPDDCPLGSVVHSAGVVDDGVIALLTPDRLDTVLRPKVDAAWHLHELTAGMDLDHFVTFSSAAATFGAPGQGSYVAANSFLDALAAYRRTAGLAGMSLQLGPWAHDAGIGRNLDERALARIDQSFVPLGADEGLVVMDVALARDEAVLMPARMDLAALRAQAARASRATDIPTLWRSLAGPATTRRTAASAAADAPGSPGEGLRRQLASVAGPDRDRLLLDLVCAQVAAVLGYGNGTVVEAGRAFTDLGFDSLTAVDMRNRLSAETGLRLPATLVFDYPNPVALVTMLREELTGDLPAVAATPAAPVPAAADEPIAVVGMACRFPGGAVGPDELWQVLETGTDVIGPLPLDRGWDLDALYDPDGERSGTMYTQAGGFVRDASGFDAPFFGISPREALAMDPQQRLLLETSWEALERAGIDPATLRGSRTGAFVGGSASGYGIDAALEEAGVAETHLMTGTAASVMSGRLSYALGLEGPAVTVDTACSSGLVALHMASQAIRAGECSLALVGGVAVAVSPAVFVAFSQAKGVSVDGRCKSFAADADGSGFSEGVGMIVLERLSDAQRNGHKVLAVVRGSAVNQDGASNGLTAPNGPSQQRVIRAALANAGVTADDIDVVEAHGSATTLGDPIEAQALIATYGQDRPEDRPLWLGSVKSNIGHTQTAAGSAGIIKMVLALQNQRMPRTLHAEEPTPHVDWSAGTVRLLHEPVQWPAGGGRIRRAGVSAFGMSGTNVHVILEEAPAAEQPPAADDRAPLVTGATAWTVSSRTADGLTAQADRLRDWVTARPQLDPAEVAWSLASTRSAFEHRAVVVGGDREELTAGLLSVAERARSRSVVTGVTRANGRTAFIFAGQGTQWIGMGRDMQAASPVFAARLAECERALTPYVEWSLSDVLSGADGAPELAAADVVQPVLWAVMVSLAAVWQAAGIRPDAVLGHSQGEIAAATVAGMLSLDDAARVVAVRSRALTGLSVQGSMVSVVMPAEPVRELAERWGDRLSLAAVNSPAASVVSGHPDALAEFERELAARHVMRWRIPATDFVAHSPAVEPLAGLLHDELATITPRAGQVPMVSTVTGEWVSGEELDAAYWYANLRRMVRFEQAVRVLLGSGYGAFVEVSPHPVLTAATTETAEDAGSADTLVVGTLERDNGGAARMLTSLAQAHVGGLPVDWTAVLPAAGRADLPTYAFQHQRYWLEPASAATPGAGTGTPAEDAFWAAVEGNDLARLADTLAIPNPTQLSDVVPALASWRRREQQRSATANWRYRIAWAPVTESGPARLTGQWLVVTPAGTNPELSRDCVTALAARGAQPVVVDVPADITDRDAMAGLLADTLRRTGTDPAAPLGAVSLLALDETPLPAHPAVPRGLAATLALTQALGDTGVLAPLWLLTRGAVTSGPGELLTSPLQAQTWGFGRVVALEYPDRWGGMIDLPAVLDDRAGARLATVLAGCDENQVMIRPAGIMGRRMTRAPQPATSGRWSPEHGSTLITGGNGALAGHVARWLAGSGADRLVLTSRSGPSGRDVAAHAAGLAAHGSRVDVLTCDVSDRAELAALIDRTRRDGTPLSAVVHTAGVLDDGVIDRLSAERLDTVLAAKAASAAYLDELTAELDLDAFVLFSSVVATTGGPGQANYAAANAYLDAVAEHRRGRGLPALAVAWGPWSGGGVAQGSEAARQRLARNQWEGLMDPDLAVRALGEALDGADTMLTVTNIDWPLILQDPQSASGLLQVPVMRDLPEIHQLAAALKNGAATAEPQKDLARRIAGETPAAQRRILTDLIRAAAANVLGFASPDEVDAGRAFSDFGFDSLTSVELRNDLMKSTELRLPATLLFDYPNPTVLAEYLQTELLGAVTDAAPATVGPALAAGGDDIAIVGLSCRYPGGVADPDSMWALLTSGGDAISGFPDDRGWDLDALASGSGYASYVQAGGFIQGMSEFDAGFFGISPREALAMDPQQRLLLEVSWEALERAGIDPQTLRGSATGVFAGGYASGYGIGADLDGAAHLITGNATSVLSGRVSYALGLEGPAVTVDTACSSSLVALHLAAQALRSGECAMALAGGITVLVTPDGFVGFSEQSGLARDGRCKAFSAQADGMGFAEGAGMIVLERLSDARRNGHTVLAVLRGSAINQDGASNGLTAPNGPSQQRVIRAALANAGLTASDVDVVEAHGTGTKLGDPIEAQALLATYGQQRPQDRPLLLGSVKSNIGHTQAAAGVAGVIKMVLALQHQHLPRTLHADEPSPHVDWSAGEVRLLNEPVPWTAGDRPRRAGVSSFGLSGTNAHVILEEAPAAPEAPAPEERTPLVTAAGAWVVSGRSADGLTGQAARLRDWMTLRPGLDPAGVAWSLATTRSAFEHRAVIVGDGADQPVAGLDSVATGLPSGSVISGTARPGVRSVFVFPGQGSQWVGMGCELASDSPVFAARLAECEQALAPYVEWSLADMLSREDQWTDADVVQPLLWAVMVSLAAVWEAAGVAPDAVVGHSQGEIAAATVAGMLSLDDAARVVALRSQTLRALSGAGGMMSVAASAESVEPLLDARVSLAAVNGPASVVVSGEPEALEELQAQFEADGVRARMVAVDYASHGPQVDVLEQKILSVLEGISPRAGRVPMVSAMSGETLTGTELDAAYWFASLRNPVQFERAVRTLAGLGHQVFVEVTPHPVLLGAIGDTVQDAVVTGTLRRDDGGATRLLTSLAEAFVAGAAVDWTRVLPAAATVELPTYAFQHVRYWPKPLTQTAGDPASLGLGAVDHPLLGAAVELAGGAGVVCTGRLSVRTQPWLADHAVGGVVLLPGTGFVELAVRAGDQVGCGQLEELTLQAPLVIPADGGGVHIQVVVTADDGTGRRGFEIFSRPDEPGTQQPWVRHAGGQVAPAVDAGLPADDLTVWPPRDATPVDITGLYDSLGASYQYGPAFQALRTVWRRGADIFAEVALPDDVARDAAAFGLHPALLDGVLHAGFLAGEPADAARPGQVRLPFAWTGVRLHAGGASVLRARLRRDGNGDLMFTAADAAGAPVVSVDSLVTRPMAIDQLRDTDPGVHDALFAVDWIPVGTIGSGALDGWALLGADRFGVGITRTFDHADDDLPRAVVTCLGGDGDVAPSARRVTTEALELVQRWVADDRLETVPLVVLTRGAVSAVPGEGVRDLAAAAAWGLLRSAQSENPGRLILVDLDGDPGVLASVVDAGEAELAVRGATVLARRLTRPSGELALPAGAWRLEPDTGGSLEDLVVAAAPDAGQPLEPGLVRVAVRAAGLNFRDVLIGLGMYPGGGVLGSEIAGVVIEVGPGVVGLAVGDRVMGIAAGGFGPLVVTDSRQVVRIPQGWSYTRAASAPVAFLTAWYALVVLAEARAGQKVLIHAAAGGVGSAAVQIARHLGLEVFATASPAKWPVLRAAGLDDDHIASSRDAGFAEKFAGVDVVVNSLAGELTDASLRLVADGGAFIEMGKTDLRDPATLTGVRYRPFELSEAGPQRIGEMLHRIVELVDAGELALLPTRAWDVRRAREAMRFMSQARHTGKLVLTIPPIAPATAERRVLVTGGTGTLGGLVARHLAESGRADSLLLTSRSGPDATDAAGLAARLADGGATVRVVAVDAADRDGLDAVLRTEKDLTAVVHTAGVLDDGVIGSLTGERVERVMRPKVDGAWNLHELTQRYDLDEFVLFSSAASVMGAPGQGNYVAANAFLDALAAERRASGLPATSLAWGMWAQLSALTGRLTDEERARISRGGIGALTAEQGLALLDAALTRDEALLVPARFDLPKLRAQAAGAADIGQVPALWRALVQPGAARRTATSAVAGADGLREQLSALSAADRLKTLSDLVRTQVAAVLGHAGPATIEAGRAFTDLGFDSLTAVELRNRLNTATGLRLPATLVFDYPNPTELAEFLQDKLLPELGEAADPAETELRTALATLPMSRLREAGLMEALMQLAGIRGEAPAEPGTPQVEAIDDLDADALIRLALDNETN
ncbi:type I polyketide synthase [Krasilnikovia sp. MM14-A1259]